MLFVERQSRTQASFNRNGLAGGVSSRDNGDHKGDTRNHDRCHVDLLEFGSMSSEIGGILGDYSLGGVVVTFGVRSADLQRQLDLRA